MCEHRDIVYPTLHLSLLLPKRSWQHRQVPFKPHHVAISTFLLSSTRTSVCRVQPEVSFFGQESHGATSGLGRNFLPSRRLDEPKRVCLWLVLCSWTPLSPRRSLTQFVSGKQNFVFKHYCFGSLHGQIQDRCWARLWTEWCCSPRLLH